MKVLYAIQGTGNGHLSRALEIVPILQKKVNLDVLVSGIQGDIVLPFPVKYKFRGLSFIFGKEGGVDLYKTIINIKSKKIYNEIKSLPIHEYDLVISDFEPVSAWACYFAKKECISLSHQAAVIHPNAPRPKQLDIFGSFILNHYAPSTHQIGFHFQNYSNHIFTPVIRKTIREAEVKVKKHYTVYLPSYDNDKLIKFLEQFPSVQWHVFSKHTRKKMIYKNIDIEPVNAMAFIHSLCNSKGVLCGAGFETPAEALYLNKKLLVVPMKNQYEQHCNAAALELMGVPVIKSIKNKHIDVVDNWLHSPQNIEVDYPDQTALIIDKALSMITL